MGYIMLLFFLKFETKIDIKIRFARVPRITQRSTDRAEHAIVKISGFTTEHRPTLEQPFGFIGPLGERQPCHEIVCRTYSLLGFQLKDY